MVGTGYLLVMTCFKFSKIGIRADKREWLPTWRFGT